MATVLKLHVDKAEPVLRGQDHMWRVMRTLGSDGRTFSAADVAALSEEGHKATITTYLRRLCKAGIAACDHPDSRYGLRYRLLRSPERRPIVSNDGEIRPPRSAQQQMWNVMRGPAGRSGFTYQDLITYGSTDDLSIRPQTAKSYIKRLYLAGYLLPVEPGRGRTPGVWRLKPSRNTGPQPPMILRAKLVFDPNRHALMGDVIAEEETP